MEPGNASTSDPHLINISLYKPNALCSFWNWFSRKSKNNLTDILEKGENFDIKLNAVDLNALKMNGIDLKKFQNCKFVKTNSKRKNNVFVNHKNHLETNANKVLTETAILNLMKKENVGKNKKIYEKRIMSTSTISIKSKTNFGTRNVKYVRNITSQKSIMNSMGNSYRKTRVKDNKSTESNPLNRSVLLKSVPTAILKSNTQKKVFVPIHIGRRKAEKINNKWQNSKLPDIRDPTQEQKQDDSNVIPMILTKMKSMEEQLCDIESTTKKINEVVSQNSIKRTNSLPKDLNQSHQNRQPLLKGLPSHKIYSRNIQASKKSKPTTHKKLKNKCKLTIPTTFNDFQVQDLRFQTVHNDANPSNNFGKPSMVRKQTFNKSKLSLEMDIIPDINDPKKENLPRLNQSKDMMTQNEDFNKINQKIDYKFILKLLKEMSDTKYNEIGLVQASANNTKEQTFMNNNLLSNTHILMSKPTFDWKHKSLSSASETQTEKGHELNIKDKTDTNVAKENLNLDVSVPNLQSDTTNISKYKDLSELDTMKKEFNKVTDECIKENKTVENSVLTTGSEIIPEVHNLVQISEQEFIKQDYSLLICRDMIKRLKETNNSIIPKNPSDKEIEKIDSVSKSNYKQFQQNREILDSSKDVHQTEETLEYTLRKTKSKQQSNLNINELFMMNESLVKKMITRATQCEPEPSDGVKVCVETPSGDKVKIEKLSCGKGLSVITSSRVSLIKATTTLNDKCVNKYEEENNYKNSFILPKNDKITPNNCIISETLNKEDICLKTSSHHRCSIEKGFINKQGHLYKGIDKFVPAKKVESENFAFRCPGEYMSQAKRKTYEELLKKGSLLSQCSAETVHQPHLSTKINEITLLEKPIRKSVNSYAMPQEKHSNSFMSIDMQLNPKNKQVATSYTEKNKLLLEKKDYESGGDYLAKHTQENPVKNKRTSLLELNQNQNIPINKQTFFTVKNELQSNAVVRHQNTLDSKRRSCRYGLTIQEPIVEESDNAETVLENTISDYQSEKGDNITVKSFDKSICTEHTKINCNDSSEMENNCKVFTAQLQNVKTTFNYLKDSTCMKTSVSVQTDWSLIGITVDHFNQGQPRETCKTSQSSQTEITMDLLSITGIANTILPITCSTCTSEPINTDIEKTSTNFDSLCHTSDDKKQTNDNDQILTMVMATTKDKEINKPHEIPERITYSNFQASKQTKKNYTKGIDFDIFTEIKSNEHEVDLKKLPKNKNYTVQHHDCSISCFPSISEETILSEKSEINYEQILSTEFNSTLSEINNNSIISCYNINKEVISINKCPNIINLTDVDKESSLKSYPLIQIPTNRETNQTLFRSQNNVKVAHFLPLPLDTAEHQSNSGMVTNSNTTIEIVTTKEMCSPIKETHTAYQCNTFQNNICTQITTG